MIGGTIIGRVGQTVAGQGRASRLLDPARPAGARRGSIPSRSWTAGSCSRRPRSTAPPAATCSTARTRRAHSIGQILLLPKPLLEKRVLADERIEIYECGRDDIRSGQIDRRVLATLAYLAESGLQSDRHRLKCGHGFYTSSGNVSEHSSGNAVDIAADQRHPDPGPPGAGRHHRADRRRLMLLQGTMAPPRSSRCSRSAGPPSPWPTTPTTSTSASSRCSARTRGSASRRSPCSSPASGPT